MLRKKERNSEDGRGKEHEYIDLKKKGWTKG